MHPLASTMQHYEGGGPGGSGGFIAAVVIPLVLLVLGLISVLIFVLVRNARARQEQGHAERMKALELGRSAEWFDETRPRLRRTAFWLSFFMGVLVPAGSIIFAGAMAAAEHITGLMTVAGFVSVAGILGATVLMFTTILVIGRRPSQTLTLPPAPLSKTSDGNPQQTQGVAT